MDDLSATAERWGVEKGYHDVFGGWHEAGPETLARVVMALSEGREGPAAFPALSSEHLRAFQGDGRRVWGLAVQLYALRSRRNWGHGDFTDLKRLVEIAAARGASAVALNPLHALFPDRPEDASPYAPNSRLFLNPLYIDVEAIPEFPGAKAAGLEAAVAALSAPHMVNYTGVAHAKLGGLRFAYERFRNFATPERRGDFDAYRQEQGEALLRFACFETLRQQFAPKPWAEWDAPWQSPSRNDLNSFREKHPALCEFHEFLQWTADRQLKACQDAARARGMPIGLYVDLAVGIDPRGADAWSQQDAVLADMSVGAPPDEFNLAGQNWGLAPFNPNALATNDFAPMRVLMTAVMRHAGAIRLDHVLGLKRIFMIPRGKGPADGVYVRLPFEPLLQVIAEESHRQHCVVVGEDLGTVPDGFRDTLARWGLWTYRVMLFEREGNGRFRPPESYPADAVATFSTHDLASFRGWISGHDLAVKRAIGVDPGESDDARDYAWSALRAALAERASGYAQDDLAAVASYLGQTPSRLVVVGLDDILGEIEQINIPGTTDQHPNWRRRLPVAIEDLEKHEGLQRVAKAFAQAGRSIVSSV